MENLFERIVDLLGKTPDHPDSRQFVRDLEEQPVFAGAYNFMKSGFMLVHEKHVFTAAIFHLSEWEDHPNSAYSGRLPGDVKANDDIEDVREKLNIAPRINVEIDSRAGSEEPHEEEYDLPQCTLRLSFDATNRLTSVVALRSPSIDAPR